MNGIISGICIAIVIAIGALFTLVMKESPNTNAPTFGTFTTAK